MGEINTKVKLTNAGHLFALEKNYIKSNQVRSIEIKMLVDTGAAMICLPLSVIQQLDLTKTGERTALTANGKVSRGVFSPVRVEVMDRSADLGVMELPDDGTPPLFGFLALEAMDLIANPISQQIEGNPKHDGKMMISLY